MPRIPCRVLLCLLVTTCASLSVEARADQGITSPAHREHVGKIVYSADLIPFRKEAPEAFKGEFTATSPIYGRVYLARSLANTEVQLDGSVKKGSARDFEVRLFVGELEQKYAFDVFHRGTLAPDAAEAWTTWRFDPHPLPGDKAADLKVVTGWAKTVNALAPGRHTVRVEVWVTEGQMRSAEPVAAGSFALTKTKGDRLSIGGAFPADVVAAAEAGKLKEAARAALLAEGVAKKGTDILGVAITSQVEEGRYADTKAPYRQVSAAVKWADANGDGFCKFVTYNLVQDQAASGWGTWRFKSFCNGAGCQEGEVDCE
ncbi:MAG: hypothetical protein R3F39_17075 [Myxococcota bacterium]